MAIFDRDFLAQLSTRLPLSWMQDWLQLKNIPLGNKRMKLPFKRTKCCSKTLAGLWINFPRNLIIDKITHKLTLNLIKLLINYE